MRCLYPPVQPHDSGMLDAGDGNRIYWEVCGNPRGKPVVALPRRPNTGVAPRAAWVLNQGPVGRDCSDGL